MDEKAWFHNTLFIVEVWEAVAAIDELLLLFVSFFFQMGLIRR